MNAKFTFKHMEALESVENYSKHRIEKVEKYSLHKNLRVHFIFEYSKKRHKAEILIDVGNHHYTAKAIEDDMYVAIDKAVSRVEKQLAKEKDKVKNHHKTEKPDFRDLYKDSDATGAYLEDMALSDKKAN